MVGVFVLLDSDWLPFPVPTSFPILSSLLLQVGKESHKHHCVLNFIRAKETQPYPELTVLEGMTVLSRKQY
jgi:hypothetical protein